MPRQSFGNTTDQKKIYKRRRIPPMWLFSSYRPEENGKSVFWLDHGMPPVLALEEPKLPEPQTSAERELDTPKPQLFCYLGQISIRTKLNNGLRSKIGAFRTTALLIRVSAKSFLSLVISGYLHCIPHSGIL